MLLSLLFVKSLVNIDISLIKIFGSILSVFSESPSSKAENTLTKESENIERS